MRNFRNLSSISAKDLTVTLKPAGFFIVFDGVNRWVLCKPAYNVFDGKHYRVHFRSAQIIHFRNVFYIGNGRGQVLLRNDEENG